MMEIKVVDSIMGSGKTSWAIQMMNDAPDDKRFIFITPYLTEVQRVKENVTNRTFVEPKFIKGETKLSSLKQLIVQGKDIASTHALFRKIDDDVVELLRDAGYTLILDEVVQVVEGVNNISKKDIEMLEKQGMIEIEEDFKVYWSGSCDSTRYDDIRELANSQNLYSFRKHNFLIWLFPSRIFETFDEVYVLTYLFDGQLMRYYFEWANLPFGYKAVAEVEGSYKLVEYNKQAEKREELMNLINLYEGKMNDIGKRKNSLSATWLRNADKDTMKLLSNNTCNFFRHICNISSEQVYFTTLKEAQKSLKPNGYAKRFVPFNIRATNEYAECSAVAYIFNRYSVPTEIVFFQENGISVNEELLAVSDLLQWLWRSQLRKGKEINAYIPSDRMRKLLKDWGSYQL